MEIAVDKKFEDALQDLEGVVEKLDAGTLSLEESLQAFEEGVALVRFLEEKLTEVEKRVEVLTRDNSGLFQTQSLETDEEGDA
ncbi:MAG: exodeoxyribonuclease VII small subunit [Desulfurellaceae bacterium]|nr:exodeoxyribonuclease VII small subunit [Desulfurellaceae bacterium]